MGSRVHTDRRLQQLCTYKFSHSYNTLTYLCRCLRCCSSWLQGRRRCQVLAGGCSRGSSTLHLNSSSTTREADDVFPGSHFRAVRNWLQRGKTFVLERLLQTLNLTHTISTHLLTIKPSNGNFSLQTLWKSLRSSSLSMITHFSQVELRLRNSNNAGTKRRARSSSKQNVHT